MSDIPFDLDGFVSRFERRAKGLDRRLHEYGPANVDVNNTVSQERSLADPNAYEFLLEMERSIEEALKKIKMRTADQRAKNEMIMAGRHLNLPKQGGYA